MSPYFGIKSDAIVMLKLVESNWGYNLNVYYSLALNSNFMFAIGDVLSARFPDQVG